MLHKKSLNEFNHFTQNGHMITNVDITWITCSNLLN